MVPRMISQIPTTIANVSIESNGYAGTTKPAMVLVNPKKIALLGRNLALEEAIRPKQPR